MWCPTGFKALLNNSVILINRDSGATIITTLFGNMWNILVPTFENPGWNLAAVNPCTSAMARRLSMEAFQATSKAENLRGTNQAMFPSSPSG
jgi:hypothetical protein